jgi:hypothetical protein
MSSIGVSISHAVEIARFCKSVRSMNEQGFAYRILYIDPSLVQAALGGRPLPFVPNPVTRIAAKPPQAARAGRRRTARACR